MSLAVEMLSQTVLVRGGHIADGTLEPSRALEPAGGLLLVTLTSKVTGQLVLSGALD